MFSAIEQVQKAAVDLVEGLTGSVDGLEQLMNQSYELLPALLRLIASDAETSKAALNSLINLSQVWRAATQLAFTQHYQEIQLNTLSYCMQREDAVQQLIKLKVVGRIMDFLTEGQVHHVDLLMMLLSNVTVSDAACEELLQLNSTKVAGFNM